MRKMAMEGLVVLKHQVCCLREEEQKVCVNNAFSCGLDAREGKLVCVTSGNSNLGSHIVKVLLARGYLVRVTIQNQVDYEDMKKLMRDEEINQLEGVVVAKMGSLDNLCEAFRGCHAIFHTSSFIDPHSISGYSEQKAFLEAEAARNVIEACGRAAYVKRCIFTSSLLAAIWTGDNENKIIDEFSWTNEEFCRENKLWLALGKTNAEMTCWRKSKEMKVNLVTVCPGLLMDTSFPNAHNSVPYLKGGKVMLEHGHLAVEDANKVAEAHVYVYEAMDYGACGRYLCYGKVVRKMSEAIELENGLKIHGLLSGGRHEVLDEEIHIMLSNAKLVRLIQGSQKLSCK
ncbi:cinnamoyl-CoA reductase-like SNL6 [Prunus avium]|uniref:Cinnamoyl-CoA reductase-like SNL6 n=1 Tax=Prunus avium TaxID=42229 RepID=A0A6P5STW3_PRUAV|nr:cinnamoyl-CoA reductase-like SNL6 [Prunus avium]